MARILSAVGYSVNTEYYINDAGTQIRTFSETLYTLYLRELREEAELPENAYEGDYMVDLAKQACEHFGDELLRTEKKDDAVEEIGEFGLRRMLDLIERDLAAIGVKFDCWFSERSVYATDLWERMLSLLEDGGYTKVQDGAVWFRSSLVDAEESDNVLIRSDGRPGYFASDIAYHYNKFVERGFDWVINIWGADHQGHVPRMKAVMQVLGLDPMRLTIVLYQLVSLMRDGEVVRLSKRKGNYVTLAEIASEIGTDALRYFLLTRTADSQMKIDLDLASKSSSENPVFYIQYAHARAYSILNRAKAIGVQHPALSEMKLSTDIERQLTRQLVVFPEIVEAAAIKLAPHYITEYCLETARLFSQFYEQCPVVSHEENDAELVKVRLQIVRATRAIIAKALGLLGISAPERL